MALPILKTFIVGGGRGCSVLLPILSSDKSIDIISVCDIQKNAPGFSLAQKMGIPTTDSFEDFLKNNDVDFIIDVTGNPTVNQRLESIKKPGVEMLGGFSAKLIWELVCEREKRKQEMKQSLAEKEDLYSIGLMLLSAKNIDTVFRRIVESAIKLSESKAGSLALYNEESNEFRIEVAIGFSEKFSKIQRWQLRNNGLTDYILSNKQPTAISDIANNAYFNNSILLAEGIKSLIAVPLILDSKPIGILYVNNFKPTKISPRTTSLMALLATQATFAIEKNKLLYKAEQLAVTDELTQLYNHRYFVNALNKDINRSIRLKHPLSFLMMDIDHFKCYNDKNGHQDGNIVLQTVAKLMLEGTRNVDTLARYGGEEFSLILPGAECQKGMDIAERIRKSIENYAFPHGDSQPGEKLTISIGLACYPQDAKTGADLIEKADCALYRAKKEGRNKVIVFEPDMLHSD